MSAPASIESQPFQPGQSSRADCTLPQPLEAYTAADHAVWAQLFARQSALLQGRACAPFLHGLAAMQVSAERIPVFAEVNRQLAAASGWEIVAVPGLVPAQIFFEHLAQRRFPVTWWMRRADQLDYLEEPDCFHDLFGHVPLLIDPVFADFMQRYGQLAAAAGPEDLPMLSRLYWYTVEFGLIRDSAAGGLRIFGAGIVSSKGESLYSLESPVPHRLAFDLERVMCTDYRIDSFQQSYFVIDSFDAIIRALDDDIPALLAKLRGRPLFDPASVQDKDRLIAR
jgi:phenylalanine-4-hydroxylase